MLEEALDLNLISDALIPHSISQSMRFWDIREHIPLSQVEDGKNIKHDISLPISEIPQFLEQAEQLILKEYPNSRIIDFGHLGDGNLHYNIAAPVGVDADLFMKNKNHINELIHGLVNEMQGSISAEHGIGSAKAKELKLYKSQIELQMMKAIKFALDPTGIFNPGKILM